MSPQGDHLLPRDLAYCSRYSSFASSRHFTEIELYKMQSFCLTYFTGHSTFKLICAIEYVSIGWISFTQRAPNKSGLFRFCLFMETLLAMQPSLKCFRFSHSSRWTFLFFWVSNIPLNECVTFSPSLHDSRGPLASCFILRFAHSYDSLVHTCKEL